MPKQAGVGQQRWKCPRCGAANVLTVTRCRLCKSLGPMGTSPIVAPPPAYVPPPPDALTAPPGYALLPPPGYAPPPPPGYAPAPPPGPTLLYGPPSAPPQSNTGCIVMGALGIVVVLVVGLVVFLVQTDPAAGRDKDAAAKSLLTAQDVGPNFRVLKREAVARSRGGLRVSDGFDDCTASAPLLEHDGQAEADVTYGATNGFAAQVLGAEVIVMGSRSSAVELFDHLDASAGACVLAVLRGAGQGIGSASQLTPADAPSLGEHASALHGSVSSSETGPVFADVDVVFVQKGRAVVVLIAVDSSTSLSASRVAALVGDVVGRLPERLT